MVGERGELSCSSCKRPQKEVAQPLKRCAKCQNVLYCSKECQRTDWSSHKLVCVSKADQEAAVADNYVLEVHLRPGDIEDPAIWRTLSCPAIATFEQLHRALQVAFGWATTHTYDFKVRDPDYEAEDEDEEDMAVMIQRITATYHRRIPHRARTCSASSRSRKIGWLGLAPSTACTAGCGRTHERRRSLATG
jgi:hypothetical protein